MLFNVVKKVQKKYDIKLPKESKKFISKTKMFDYSGTTFNVKNKEYEINHFLKKGKSSSQDLFSWHSLRVPKYKDYLTIAFCIYDEEIAIKVKGENAGKVVLMLPNNDAEEVTYKIVGIADNFAKFLDMIK